MCPNSAAQVQVKKYTKFSKHISIEQQLAHYPTKLIHLLLFISFLDTDVQSTEAYSETGSKQVQQSKDTLMGTYTPLIAGKKKKILFNSHN